MHRSTRTNALDKAQDIPKAYEEMLNEIGYEARSDEQEDALHNCWESESGDCLVTYSS